MLCCARGANKLLLGEGGGMFDYFSDRTGRPRTVRTRQGTSLH